MNILKRLSGSGRSQNDKGVGRNENHDAMIDAALQESRDVIGRLKLQQKYMLRKMESIDILVERLLNDEQEWVLRARSQAKADEARAIACLDRRDQCAKQIEQLRQKRGKCAEMERQLATSVSQFEQKLIADEQRLVELRGRILSIKAERTMQSFERWHVDVSRLGMRQKRLDPTVAGSDVMELQSRREARLAAHRAELKSWQDEEL